MDLDSWALNWLMDPGDSGVRYLAMRDLLGLAPDEPQLVQQRDIAHHEGPIAEILNAMNKEGYWELPGSGYYPKYTGTVWSILLLAQLGANTFADPRVVTACRYILDHALTSEGQFTVNGLASGMADCLQGNLCYSLQEMGCDDPRLDMAFEWMARTVTGEGILPMTSPHPQGTQRYYAGKCGPLFACGSNSKLPCAWGGVKVMLAFSRLPDEKRTRMIAAAIRQGIDFFLSVDPVSAAYPNGYNDKPSSNWWKFGFPVFYVTDLLQNVESLVRLGYGKDPRLANALDLIKSKQAPQGFWLLEYDYEGKTWGNFGVKKQANKWVTLRALRVLKMAERM